jgi:periplasmic copper chaperone A
MRKSLIAAGAAAAILAAPAVASAHVTVNPREAAAGGFTVLNVRVPNERDNKGTVKVDLRLPDGFYFLSYKKVPGWKVKLTRKKLDTPVDLGGFSVSERFTRIVWTGNPNKGGIIRPDQFEEFPISVRMPDGNAGDQLVFPAFQTYRGGERVAWTGGPDADEPAPRITLTAPVEE